MQIAMFVDDLDDLCQRSTGRRVWALSDVHCAADRAVAAHGALDLDLALADGRCSRRCGLKE